MKRAYSSERGQVLVIIVLTMFGLIGITGLAIDGSRAYSDRRQAQNAADTAALAAALAYVRAPGEDWTAVGFARAASNGYNDNKTTNFVDVYHPPEEGPYAGNTEYVQVIITSHLGTLFGRVLGIEQVTNTVQAVARVSPSVPTTLYDGNAVVGLAPEACSAIKFQGTADAKITGGGLFVNSKCPGEAYFSQSGSAKLDAPSITAVGGIRDNGALIVDTRTEGATQLAKAYPPREYILPNPKCPNDVTIQGVDTLTPGNWPPSGWSGSITFPPAGVKFLQSGVYCVNNGDFKLTSSGDYLEGHGVFIWVDKGEVRLNGGTIILEAPDTGPYQGLAIYLPITNSSPILINGNAGSSFEGTILAPASSIDIKGTGAAGITGQVIGYKVELGGTSAVKIHYDDSKTWTSVTSPSIELKQ